MTSRLNYGRRTDDGLHIVRALIQRELVGGRGRGVKRASSCCSPSMCVVRRSNLNVRFGVDSVIQKHFLQEGHVVMGFTPCARYVLTYVVRPLCSLANHPLGDYGQFVYTLYFWTFVPHKFAHVHSSVKLFDRTGVVDPNLHLTIAFTDTKLAIVHARSCVAEDCPVAHVTVVVVPDHHQCGGGNKTAAADDDGGGGGGGEDAVVRVSYELVAPYPSFTPSPTCISLDEDDQLCLTINSGSHLHSLTFPPNHPKLPNSPTCTFEFTDTASYQHQQTLSSSSSSSTILTQLVKSLLINSARSPAPSPLLAIPPARSKKGNSNRFFRRSSSSSSAVSSRSTTTLHNHQQQHPNHPHHPPPFGLLPPPTRILSEETVYDSIETNVEEKISFKMYRKRQLADKMYEFSDEENSIPTSNDSSDSNNRSTRGGHNNNNNSGSTRNGLVHHVRIPRSTAFVTRTYVTSSENSYTNETASSLDEDDPLYSVALPLDVTFPYPKRKMRKLSAGGGGDAALLVVFQVSLDLEVLSNEVAAVVCKKHEPTATRGGGGSGGSSSSLELNHIIDFDSAVIHADKHSVVAYNSLLIQATTTNTNHFKTSSSKVGSSGEETTGSGSVGGSSSVDRYELSYLLEWRPLENRGKVVFRPTKLLRPVAATADPNKSWNPTKDLKLSSSSPHVINHVFAPLDNFFLAHQYTSVSSLEDVSGTITLYQTNSSSSVSGHMHHHHHLHHVAGGGVEDSSEASSTLSSPPQFTHHTTDEDEEDSSTPEDDDQDDDDEDA